MPGEPVAVGVDVGGTSTRVVGFDADHVAIASRAAATPHGATSIIDVIAELVEEVSDGGPIVGVGVGMPGRVDHAAGVVTAAVNLGITSPVPVAELLRHRLGLPVHVENDVNAAALGAFTHFRRSPSTSLAYLNVGTGIAAGFVLGGHLWRGSTGGAGEIGHVPMRAGGPVCHCGQLGCAEAIGSGRAVTEHGVQPADVVEAAAWAVQLCLMALDVDMVVVGGGMTRSSATFGGDLHRALAARDVAAPILMGGGPLARRVVIAPSGAPLGSLGAVLAVDALVTP